MRILFFIALLLEMSQVQAQGLTFFGNANIGYGFRKGNNETYSDDTFSRSQGNSGFPLFEPTEYLFTRKVSIVQVQSEFTRMASISMGVESDTRLRLRFSAGLQFATESAEVLWRYSQGEEVSEVDYLEFPPFATLRGELITSSSRMLVLLDPRFGLGMNIARNNSLFIDFGLYDYSIEFKRSLSENLRVGLGIGQFHQQNFMGGVFPIISFGEKGNIDSPDFYDGPYPYELLYEPLWYVSRSTYSPSENLNVSISLEWSIVQFRLRSEEKTKQIQEKKHPVVKEF